MASYYWRLIEITNIFWASTQRTLKRKNVRLNINVLNFMKCVICYLKEYRKEKKYYYPPSPPPVSGTLCFKKTILLLPQVGRSLTLFSVRL